MQHEINTIPLVQIRSGIPCQHPDPRTALVGMDDPAIRVMTDFMYVTPITVEPITGIDLALKRMKSMGVRLLLVTDERDNISGVITSYDIQGEKPVKYSQQSRVGHSDILVHMIMTPLERMAVVDMAYVNQSLVRHVINTMRAIERPHALVVESTDALARIRGLFSTTQIGKMLGRELYEPLHAAHSLADMQQERGTH